MPTPGQINLIKNAKKSFFIVEKIEKYLKCPALDCLFMFVLVHCLYVNNKASVLNCIPTCLFPKRSDTVGGEIGKCNYPFVFSCASPKK